MKTEKRRRQMLLHLRQADAEVEELSRIFRVSASTIRRDLSILQRQGKVSRAYGKAAIREDFSLSDEFEPSIAQKKEVFRKEKCQIAAYCADLIHEGECIFLDSGTTPAYLYEYIRHKKVTIVTNNLLLVSRVHPKDKATILFGSGRFDVQHYTLTGTSYLEFLRQFHYDACFIGVSGFDDIQKCCSCTTLEASSYKNHAMHASSRRYVIADASKRQTHGIVNFASFDQFDAVITNAYKEQAEAPLCFCDVV
ncbi:MAG: DeoR/GlpR transcriptional regulator [Erysipelotrichaceae bacterium]|jgi:DeoR family fructose operon transcriptional repressor|nr:DeoR/GlpR transcriptional regulator [Erysipelotrichaceae bacterium]